MSIEFTTIKEMRAEIEALKEDRTKLKSRTMTESIDKQIAVIEKKINDIFNKVEDLDLNKIFRTVDIEIIQLRMESGPCDYLGGCLSKDRSMTKIEYIAKINENGKKNSFEGSIELPYIEKRLCNSSISDGIEKAKKIIKELLF